MAIVFQSTSVKTYDTSTTITKPTGLSVGDLMVAQISQAGSGLTNSFSGWTAVRSDTNGSNAGVPRGSIYYKVADSSDVAASNFTYSVSSGSSAASIVRISGQDITTPINVSNGNTTLTNGTSFNLAIGVTPSYANSGLIIYALGVNATGTTTGYAIATSNPTWTEFQDISNRGSSQLSVGAAYATRPETTATGNVSFTRSVNSDCIAQIVVINESQGQVVSISETTTLTETITNLRDRQTSVSETATLTESITSALGKIFEIIESVSLSETFSAVRTFAFNVAESIGLTEMLARVRKKWSNVDKNTATFTNEDKNSSDWVNRIKN